jgi:phosphate/sulfate permease
MVGAPAAQLGKEAMHLQSLTPLFTSLTLSVVAGVCARSHHLATDSEDVFSISPAVGYLMLGCGLLCCVAPFLPGAAGDIPVIRFFWMFSPFWGGAFIAAIFFFRYQVKVTDTAMTVGAFRRRVIPFSEVIDYDEIRGGRSPELWVYLKSGKKLKFSGLLSDFEELVGMVNSHMEGLPGPQHDSEAKIGDRDKRVRDGRIANWFAYVAIFIVAVVVFVLWRTRLL